jgi:gamma-glutamyltranspeptidase/glutathione hydrolase
VRGVVAAGHPLTAEAGAATLRAGGNAVDAACAAVLASFACESPLTGLGAGGFMTIHKPGAAAGSNVVVDFFVEAPGREGVERGEELVPVDVYFDADHPQVFNVGSASCGVPGTAAGIALALERYGTMPMQALCEPAIRHAREGVPVNRQQAYVLQILEPIYTRTPEVRAIYAPAGRILREGDVFRFPELGDALERLAAEGPAPFYEGEVGRAIADFVRERGGTVSRADMAAYRPVERRPASAAFRGTEVLTNPPPSSGGILIALSLALLERQGRGSLEDVVAAMRAANDARDDGFAAGLREEGFLDRFLDPARVDEVYARLARGGAAGPDDALGSTTHLVAVDGDGVCASVTCSNGTGSSVLVPGTGVHLNNMLGEEDLNPGGFHLTPVGERLPSMMSPTVVLRDGEFLAGLGSAGSNRIRSAIVLTTIRLIDDGLPPQEAVLAPRIHYESGVVHAEPGIDEAALAGLEASGFQVVRWRERNLFFGGVQAVARDPVSGELGGGGDPRRGGAVVSA